MRRYRKQRYRRKRRRPAILRKYTPNEPDNDNFFDWLNKGIMGVTHMGPGNTIKARASNKRDAIYRKHDIAYAKRNRNDAYYVFNSGDQALLDDIQDLKRWGTHDWRDYLGEAFFTAKKYIAPHGDF